MGTPDISFPRPPIPEQHAINEEMREANRMFIAHFENRAKIDKFLPWLQLIAPVVLCLVVFYFGTNESIRAMAKDISAIQAWQTRQDGLLAVSTAKIATIDTATAMQVQAARQMDATVQEVRQEHKAWGMQLIAMDKEITELRGLIRNLEKRSQ